VDDAVDPGKFFGVHSKGGVREFALDQMGSGPERRVEAVPVQDTFQAGGCGQVPVVPDQKKDLLPSFEEFGPDVAAQKSCAAGQEGHGGFFEFHS
jgi:hypothetical protein